MSKDTTTDSVPDPASEHDAKPAVLPAAVPPSTAFPSPSWENPVMTVAADPSALPDGATNALVVYAHQWQTIRFFQGPNEPMVLYADRISQTVIQVGSNPPEWSAGYPSGTVYLNTEELAKVPTIEAFLKHLRRTLDAKLLEQEKAASGG